ncbi:dockerin type I domain-containing protein [Novipirellula sp. SH528]|uniref:dockerin type I domain-containing protein n=1 Tax=Novipirellula sp. SH528 TaxID=3454466 RepID=UPI003FA0FE41
MFKHTAQTALARIFASFFSAPLGRQTPRVVRQRRGGAVQRPIRYQTLEDRRLLVAEGDPFEIVRNVDTTGLLGNISAQVRWGDGTQTAAAVNSQPATGGLKIRFDYSLDTSDFFSGENLSRRALLQAAADSIVRRFSDELDAINPNPGGKLEWIANFTNPSTGNSTVNNDGTARDIEAKNLTVNANELVIFVGARDLAGFERGRGGPGGYRLVNPGLVTPAELASFNAFQDTVIFRGEAGAKASPPTDFGPWGGSVAFDNNGTNWYFNKDISGIQPGQTDFITVAMHELTHVLGFGNAGINKSWATFTNGNSFTGAKANAAYVGTSNPPLNQSFHWADSILNTDNQATLMRSSLNNNERQPITSLDVAALDDIGWTLVGSTVTVTANHVYGDNGSFPVEIVLTGSGLGELIIPVTTASVTNVKPTLTVASNQNVVVNSPLSITDIGSISDPSSSETFSYTVNWGDGSEVDSGIATIDQTGNATRPTLASFNGTHTYSTVGSFTVRVRVDDGDGGNDEKTFTVSVTAPPKLSLALNKSSIVENAGAAAAELTITRSGPVSSSPFTVQLKSSDTTEATIPATAIIPANATSVKVAVAAVDDALLDGDQTLELSASGTGVDPGVIDLLVKDHETLAAIFTAETVREDAASNAVQLRITRSNSNTSQALPIQVSGGNASELGFDGDFTIPANQTSVLIGLVPVNDTDPEQTEKLSYTFSASGYVSASASIDLVDDEPPLFQNSLNRFDVDSSGKVTASDALAIINALQFRIASSTLDPSKEQPSGDLYYDVNGDYRITPLDALIVINELNRIGTGQSEQLGERNPVIFAPIQVDAFIRDNDDEKNQAIDAEGLLF